jgi:hypothetical protein
MKLGPFFEHNNVMKAHGTHLFVHKKTSLEGSSTLTPLLHRIKYPRGTISATAFVKASWSAFTALNKYFFRISGYLSRASSMGASHRRQFEGIG